MLLLCRLEVMVVDEFGGMMTISDVYGVCKQLGLDIISSPILEF
jgi:hypothetical protein